MSQFRIETNRGYPTAITIYVIAKIMYHGNSGIGVGHIWAEIPKRKSKDFCKFIKRLWDKDVLIKELK